MEFSKITVESMQNPHLRVFRVAEYEFIVGFTKFNMADPSWRMNFSKITVESIQNPHPRVFRVAD